LEKCYAKIYGTYENIEFGWSEKAVHDLTGAPYEGFSYKDPNKVYKFLKEREDKKYIMTCNSKRNEKGREIASKYSQGIHSSHCYAILDVK